MTKTKRPTPTPENTTEPTEIITALSVVPATVPIASLPNLYPAVQGRAPYVAMLQRLLGAKGFFCPISGEYEARTAQAVQRLQVSRGMTPNAQVSQAEWRTLTE